MTAARVRPSAERSAGAPAEGPPVGRFVLLSKLEEVGFDTTLTDGLRIAIRNVISNASAPDERPRALPRRRIGAMDKALSIGAPPTPLPAPI